LSHHAYKKSVLGLCPFFFLAWGEKAWTDFVAMLIQASVANPSGSQSGEVVIFCCTKQNIDLKNRKQKKIDV
jgi:hypothetical protein